MTMTLVASAQPEHALLRVLLGDPRLDADDLDWSMLLPLAGRHHVLLRLADWFTRHGDTPPAAAAHAFADARERQCKTLGLVAQLDAFCTARGVSYVIPKLSQDYPDLGRGVALLVSGPPPDVDSELYLHAPASSRVSGLLGRLARTSRIAVPAHDAELDIQSGRLGRLGEHARLAAAVVARRRRVQFGAVSCCVPAAEDEVLIHVARFTYGRPQLRLRDAHWLLNAMSRKALDFDRLFAAARAYGLAPALSCLLDYADQIAVQVLGRPLLGEKTRKELERPGRWGRAEWLGDAWHYPAARVGRRLLAGQLVGALGHGNFGAASRLVFRPMAGAADRRHRLLTARQGAPARA